MSYYDEFSTYKEVLTFLKSVGHPNCFTVNYDSEKDRYKMWIGNQPYYVYEEWIEGLDGVIESLKRENKNLKKELSLLCPIGDLSTIESLKTEKLMLMEENENLKQVLEDVLVTYNDPNASDEDFINDMGAILDKYNSR